MALRQVILRVLPFRPVSIIPPTVHTHLIYMLLLAEGQTGEAWEPSHKQFHFSNQGALDRQTDNCHVPASGHFCVIFISLRADAELSWYQILTAGSSCCPPKMNFKFYDQISPPNAIKMSCPPNTKLRHKASFFSSAAYCNSALFII